MQIVIGRPTRQLTGFSFTTLTVSGTVVSLSTAIISVDGAAPCEGIICTIVGANIRVRVDGGDPSSTVGHPVTTSDTLEVYGEQNLRQLKMIKSAGDATVQVTYLN